MILREHFGDRIRQFCNLVFIVGLIISSYITKILDIGISLQDSVKYFPIALLTAAYTFSIWLPIFIGLLAYGIFQALPKQTDNLLLRSIGVDTAIAFFLITTWMLVTQLYDIENFDFIFSLSSLYFLMSAFKILNDGRNILSKNAYILVYVPISMLTGWMTVATMLTISTGLKYTGTNNFNLSETAISILLLFLSTGFVWVVNFYNRSNFFYIIPVIWGVFGIAFANIFVRPNLQISLCAIICDILLLMSMVVTKQHRNKNIFRK
jgi:hypothetical protein